jgi:hypothetical protein
MQDEEEALISTRVYKDVDGPHEIESQLHNTSTTVPTTLNSLPQQQLLSKQPNNSSNQPCTSPRSPSSPLPPWPAPSSQTTASPASNTAATTSSLKVRTPLSLLPIPIPIQMLPHPQTRDQTTNNQPNRRLLLHHLRNPRPRRPSP